MLKDNNAIKINFNDNVAVAFEAITKGHTVFGAEALCDIPAGHKIALCDIPPAEQVIKYGYPIGSATDYIRSGDHVHTHNLKTNLSGIESYEYNPSFRKSDKEADEEKSKKTSEKIGSETTQNTFLGYRRTDGKAGIRNEIWIINTVGCVNKIAEKIARQANQRFSSKIAGFGDQADSYSDRADSCNKNIEGVFTFVHPYGCSQLGDDHIYTQNILKNMVNHPNAAGVLILGLGCENNSIEEFQKALGTWDDQRVKFLNAQDVSDDVEAGLSLIEELISYAEGFQREPIPVGELVIGLKCGGSDGLSGITANTLVGSLSDAITAYGGSCLLTEVPEMFGAETLLMDRCVSEEIFNKAVDLINDFKQYFIRHGQAIYENPSPGNKDGGITTLEEKSLGCTQKGGFSPVTDVLNYGETLKHPGLNLLQGPGNDIVAVTNLLAAGAHMVLFTTGRGTPLGGPVPTVKISSNTTLTQNKPHWIDFDAGVMVNDVDPAELAHKFFEHIINVAGGAVKTKNELNDYREIAIFKDGVTL